LKLDKSKHQLPPKAFASTRYRLVYNLGSRLILKKARTKEGEQDSRNEVRLYKSVPLSLTQYLAKIIDYGLGWLVMEKARTPIPKSKASISYVRNIVAHFDQFGINAMDILSELLATEVTSF
jgi:hypothetical protein